MKKIFLITSIFVLLTLSGCIKEQIPNNNQEQNDKILHLDQQIEDLQNQVKNNIDNENLELEELKKENEELKKQLKQNENTYNTTDLIDQRIIDEISQYCAKYNISKCLPITDYTVIDIIDKYSVIKINITNYLLTKKNNEWNVSIASNENNICETGSSQPDLSEYCKNFNTLEKSNK